MTDGLAPAPVEVELKYRMSDVEPGQRLLAADELAGLIALGPPTDLHVEDRYLDTPDAALAEAGYAGRLRSSEAGTIITLKGLRRTDGGGAAHRREELEGAADASLPPAEWPASAARDRVVEIVGDQPLQDLVTVRQVRHQRLFGVDGAIVELSLDDVEVVADGRVIDHFAELEAELREGDESVLGPLAALLGEADGLAPSTTSKLKRAMAAVSDDRAAGAEARGDAATPDPADPADPADQADQPAQPEAADAADEAEEAEPTPEPRLTAGKTPGVVADDHLAEAGRKVLRFHLARMVAREPGAREGTVSEELHGMRVATRRQRAAWRVFGDAFDQERTARHQRRLKEVARDLGAVRDLDVLIEAGEAYQQGLAAEEGEAFEPLLADWRGQRDAARLVLIRELDSRRYQRWVDDYIAFVQAEGVDVRIVGPVEPHRVRDTMPSRIWAAYEGVRGYEPVMRWADVTTLHDLRIAAKWLRYTIEFVREALGSESSPLIERVVALQDHLGWMHDADVAAGLARAFLVNHAGDLTEAQSAAIGRYLVDRERELAKLRRTVGPAWRGVASLGFRRGLGRLVAGL